MLVFGLQKAIHSELYVHLIQAINKIGERMCDPLHEECCG